MPRDDYSEQALNTIETFIDEPSVHTKQLIEAVSAGVIVTYYRSRGESDSTSISKAIGLPRAEASVELQKLLAEIALHMNKTLELFESETPTAEH